VTANQSISKKGWRNLVGKERIYNRAFEGRDDVVLWDVFPVIDEEALNLVFESKNSEWEQGVWLMCDKGISIEGHFGKSIHLWYGHSPDIVPFICHTKNGLLSVYNIWDRGQGSDSQSHSSGMLIEEHPNGRRYRCNDIGFDTQFDKLVFQIERKIEKNI
jgi:hypothetical protein